MDRSYVGSGAVAVSPHYLASQAGVEILQAGGNAVDAAIAVNAVVGVVRPTDCGIGGDLFALIHRPGDDTPAVLNASGRAGNGASAGALRDAGFDQMPIRHPAAITVPGCIDGWIALLDRFGALSLEDVLGPAIRLASDGFPISVEMAANLAALADEIADQPSGFEFYPGGHAPVEGEILARPALAQTLGGIASQGRNGFYAGEVAAAIETATGGWVTAHDLDSNAPDWVEPARLDVLGETAWTVPPNSQGYITLATLAIFEQLGAPDRFDDPDYHHLLIEAYRAAAWDRELHLADPDAMTVRADDLLHPLRLGERASAVTSRAGVWPRPNPLPGGTAYMCTLDAAGMGVSLMQSNFHGIGSGVSAGSTGVWLHSRGAGFSLDAGHPNELAPGKRPAHTLAPSLWTSDGALSMLLGSRGGDLQPQLVAQLAADLLHLGMDPAHAQAMPRWALDHFGPGVASAPALEDTMPAAVVDGLSGRGHDVTTVPAQPAWGPVSIIRITGDGVHHAAADPRISTAAVVVADGT
ncbi:MAG: gamma-glutamyltransferase family protein [Acidimicrobiia bacterium]|nr:gamma-glutamyltransferase family protein [Acidimicrobiia bacterium]